MTTVTKYRSTFTHQFLAGITAGDWWRILRENKLAVDTCYWHRAAFLTAMSVINSRYRWQEERTYNAAIAATKITTPPIFILGHWRSGTTHLHNLLMQNQAFAAPTVYQACFPHTFLSTEHSIPRRVAPYIPKTRVFDNVMFHLQQPQEDEFAVCTASGYSMLLGMVFPQRVEHYDRYLTLRDVPHAEIEQWKATLLWFLKKLTYRYNQPIVLKSPPHTARIRLLLELFPDARFIHICRNPYAVFQSTHHMYDTMVWHTYLQQPDVARVSDQVLRRYVTMYDAYFAERALIPLGQLHELRFEDVQRDPMAAMRELYTALGIDSFDTVAPTLRTYVESLRSYQQNEYVTLEKHERARVAQAWGRNFAEWGYPVE